MDSLVKQQHIIMGMILISIILRCCLCITAMPIIEFLCSLVWLIAIPMSMILWLQDRPKIGSIGYLLILYGLSYLYSSYTNHTEYSEPLTYLVDIFMLIGVFYSAFKRCDSYPIYITIITLSVLTYINFIALLFFPNGLPLQGENLFLLGGNYNQMGKVYILGIVMQLIYYKKTRRFRTNLIIFSIISILSLLFVGSMTSCVGIAILLGFSFLPTNKLRSWGLIAFIATYFIFHIVIVFQGGEITNQYIVGFVENVLHKDMTFTYRTDIWIRSLLSIANQPEFGYGFQPKEWYISEIGAIMPHNFILSTLMKGGYVLMIIVVLMILCSYSQYRRHRDYPHQMLFIGLWVFLFMMIMEVYSSSFTAFIFICLAYIHLLEEKTASTTNSIPQ